MERRIITKNQILIYLLCLNPVTGRCEDNELVAVSCEYENLKHFYLNNLLPSGYRSEKDNYAYYKVFTENSVLEYYNPCPSIESNQTDYFGHGIHSEWIDEENYESLIRYSKYGIEV